MKNLQLKMFFGLSSGVAISSGLGSVVAGILNSYMFQDYVTGFLLAILGMIGAGVGFMLLTLACSDVLGEKRNCELK